MTRYEVIMPGKPGMTLGTEAQARSKDIADFYCDTFQASLIKLKIRKLVEVEPGDPQARIAELEAENAELKALVVDASKEIEHLEGLLNPAPSASDIMRLFPRSARSSWTVEQVQNHWEVEFDNSKTGRVKDRCPCCNKNMQIYRRPVHKSMAIGLKILAVYLQANNVEYAHLDDVYNGLGLGNRYRGDLGKFLHHGMVKQKPGRKGDGNPETGHWGIPQLGYDFLTGKVGVPSFVVEYGSEVLKISEQLLFFDEITEHFDYDRDIRGLCEEAASEDASVVKRESADPTDRESVSLGSANLPAGTISRS